MKKALFVFVSLFFATNFAKAIECPKLNLECKLQKVDSRGIPYTAYTKTAKFVGVNHDEPSNPATQCETEVIFAGPEQDTFFHAFVNDSLQAFLYLTGAYGSAIGPQYSVEAVPGKSFEMIYHQQTVSCVLK